MKDEIRKWVPESIELSLPKVLKIIFKRKEIQDIRPLTDKPREIDDSSILKDNLPEPLYSKFLGRDDDIEKIMNYLRNPNSQRILGISGTGGVGKSSLARKIAEECKSENLFTSIWWSTAKKKTIDIRETHVTEDIINYEAIVKKFITWAGISHQLRNDESLQHKEKVTIDFLERYPLLIILDNLETSENQNMIAYKFQDILKNSNTRVIMTSRDKWDINSLSMPLEINVLQLAGLSPEASLALIRSLAQKKIPRIQSASDSELLVIAKAVGNIPLALKLCVGLLENNDIKTILEKLKFIQSEKVKELYEFLYRDSWNSLIPASKTILMAIYQFDLAQGIGSYLLRRALFDTLPEYDEGIEQLDRKGLIEISTSVEDTRYYLHPLTANFIRAQLPHNNIK